MIMALIIVRGCDIMSYKHHNALNVSNLTAAVRIAMIKLKYSSSTMCIYDCIWQDLIQYCNLNHIDFFDENVANSFSLDCYHYKLGDSCSKKDDFRKKTVTRAMQHLMDYQSYGVIFQLSSRDNYKWHERYKSAFDRYIASMINRGYAKSTLITVKSCLAGFQQFILQKNIYSLSDLNPHIIEEFILTYSKYARSTIPTRMLYLKLMLEHFYQNGITADDLSLVCPKIKHGHFANSFPSVFSPEEMQRILMAIDRSNPCGKRDYALILLIVRLALRIEDAIHLSFSDIDWHQKTVHITQIKTKERVKLPLPEDVGWAIIEYLQNGRPKTDCKYIFVKHNTTNGHYEEFETSPYHVLQKYLSRAGIATDQERRHGFHALRHSLASELLKKDIPLPVISGILGHSSSESTSVYLSVDLEQLRKCALEVNYEDK